MGDAMLAMWSAPPKSWCSAPLVWYVLLRLLVPTAGLWFGVWVWGPELKWCPLEEPILMVQSRLRDLWPESFGLLLLVPIGRTEENKGRKHEKLEDCNVFGNSECSCSANIISNKMRTSQSCCRSCSFSLLCLWSVMQSRHSGQKLRHVQSWKNLYHLVFIQFQLKLGIG